MAITAINVVVARMMPSSVRKLRSLLERRESAAIAAASRNDAVCLKRCPTKLRDETGCNLVPYFQYPVYENLIQPEAWLSLRDEPEMAPVLGGEQAQMGIRSERRVVVDRERDHRIVLGLDNERGN